MTNHIIFLVFVAILELIYYIQNDFRAMATLGIVAVLFGLIFFLQSYSKGGKFSIAHLTDYWMPPHMRVKKIVVGGSETSNNTVIRIKKQDKKIHNDEGNRDGSRDINSSQTPTSCIIPIAGHNNRNP